MAKNKNSIDLTVPSIISSISLLELDNIPEATRQGIIDLDNLLNESLRRAHQEIAQKQGFIYEYLEAYKFNQNAALRGEDFRAYVTSSIEGNGTHPADIVISPKDLKGIEIIDQALAQFQLKSSSSHMYPAKEFFRQDYHGMGKVTNPEHVDRIKELYQNRYEKGNIYHDKYKELIDSLDREVSYGEVKSGGSSYKEVIDITENTEKFVKNEKLKLYIREGGELVLYAAGISFVLTLAMETLAKREINKDSLIKSLNSAGKTGTISLVSYILKPALNNTPVIGAIAHAIVAGIESTYLVAKGEISGEEGAVRVSKAISGSTAALYGAGVGTIIGGPIGAIVGGFIGYAVGSSSFVLLESMTKANRIKKEKTKEAFLALELFKKELNRRADTIILHLAYTEKLIKEGNKLLKDYLKSDDEKHIDAFCDLFGLKKIDNDEFEKQFYSNKPLIL